MASRVYKASEGKCYICNNEARMCVEDLESHEKKLLCTKHYVSQNREEELNDELISITKLKDPSFWSSEMAKQINKDYPQLANKHGRILRKIAQQEERPKNK